MSLRIDRAQLEIVIGNDQARKRMREIDEEVKELNKEIRKLKKEGEDTSKQELQVKRLIREYDKLTDSIGLTGSSIKELRRRQRELIAILQSLPGDSPLYKQYREQLEAINGRLKELNVSARDTQKILNNTSSKGGFLTVLKGVFAGNLLTKGAMMLKDLAVKARDFVREGVQMAAASQGIQHAFERIADRDYLDSLRRQTKGLVSDLTLMKSAVRAENFNIPLKQLGTLLEFAQNRARDTGESVDYLVESIINGIGRKSPLILDNLGISAVRLQEEVKKTGDFVAAVGKIIEGEMEKAGPAIDTAADAATRKKVAWENLQLAVGNFFVGFRSGWDDFTTRFAEGLTKLLQGQEKASIAFDNQINKVADLNVNLFPLLERYEELQEKSILSTEEQTELNRIMQTISQTIPGVISEFDKYGNILSINTDKVYDFIEAEKAKLEVLNRDRLREYRKELEEVEKQLELLNKQQAAGGKTVAIPGGGTFAQPSYVIDPSTIGEVEAEIQKLGQQKLGLEELIQDLSGQTTEQMLQDLEKRKEAQNNFNKMDKIQLETWIKNNEETASEYLEIAQRVYNNRFASTTETVDGNNKTTKTDKKEKDPFQEELKLLKENQKREILELKQGLLEKEATEEEFRDESYKKESAHLIEMRALYESYGQDTVDIDMQITDRLIAEANRRYKLEQEAEKKNQEEIAAIEKDAADTKAKEEEDRLKEIEERRREIMDGIGDEYTDLYEFLYGLNVEWLNDFLDKWGVEASKIAETGANIINAAVNFNRAEEMAIERRYNKMIQAAGNNSRKVQQLEEEKEKKLHEVRAKYADKQFILTVAQVIASTAVSAMEAFKAMAGIPVVGPALGAVAAAAAVAYGASQIAVAKQQRDAAKEGYRTGGYTGRGDDRDEAGVVHRNEFVNTADAVRNPHVKRFLDVFDVAQKNGTIRMLNTTQILERAKLANNAPARQAAVDNSPAPSADLETIETLNRLRDSVDRFTEKLDIPIKTYTVIHGTQGARRQNELYDRIMKNARL
ncbi:hypothetical protein [Proteiniphilum sp. X52]|uniref:hypothetical protein n=1 Tax=Proteiniphilum sp. X52 TaxID=2382159 RepID=UPI000F0A7142|nr:hypothetical protein [Proteiniphilum sp. X52]RNC65692.1 hypothetical protein D7D25_05985 [Proteiniphilum sp. X52]